MDAKRLLSIDFAILFCFIAPIIIAVAVGTGFKGVKNMSETNTEVHYWATYCISRMIHFTHIIY